MKHFLLEYDRHDRVLLRLREYGADQVASAIEDRIKAELDAHRLGRDIEVVLLETASEEMLHHTHSAYFQDLEKPLRAAAAG